MSSLGLLPSTPIEWAAVATSYLLGSVPFGLLLGLVFKGVDIRRSGSRNIGATNAGRVLGRKYAFIAFACDLAKGWLPTFWLGPALAEDPSEAASLAVLCGAAAVVGHVYPLYLRFRGGKAVATGSGALVGIDPVIFLGGGVAWLVTVALTRYVGLASIVMCIAFPLVALARQGSKPCNVLVGPETVIGATALAILVVRRHRANIGRMLAGEEPRMQLGRRRPAETQETTSDA